MAFDLPLLPSPGESNEHFAHRVHEAMLEVNWLSAFQEYIDQYQQLSPEADAYPVTRRASGLLVPTIGTGGLYLWQRDVLVERRAFEEQFGV